MWWMGACACDEGERRVLGAEKRKETGRKKRRRGGSPDEIGDYATPKSAALQHISKREKMARRKQAHLTRNNQEHSSDGGRTKMVRTPPTSSNENSSACPASTPRKSLTSSALRSEYDFHEDDNSTEAWGEEEDFVNCKRNRNDRDDHDDEDEHENHRDSEASRRNALKKGTLTCALCHETLNSQHELTVHLRQHNEAGETVTPPPSALPSHTCSVCGKKLSSAASLDRHMLVHSGERPFRCRLCGMTFTTNGNMHRHMRAHHEVEQQQQSLLSQISDTSPSPAKRHKKTPPATDESATGTEPVLNCPICVKSFLCKYGLQSHMESEHPTPAETSVPAETPVTAVTTPKTNQSNGSARAPRSPRVAKTAAERRTPESDCEVGFQDLTFVDFSAQKFALIAKDYCENHLRRPSSESQAFQCRVCYRAFPIGDALALHTRTAHPAPSNLNCHSCQKSFATPEALHQHARTRHRKVGPTNSESHIDKENFLALFELQTKPLPPMCPSSRKDVAQDLADIKSILAVTGTTAASLHSNGTSPAADSEAQSPEPATVPEADGAATPTLGNEAAKGSEESGDSPGARFPCKLCESVFPNLRALKGHSRNHLGMSPYRCSICPYVSVDKSTLQRHLRTHNGERPYLCKACHYPFTTKANCERHIRKRHGKSSKQDIMAVMHYGAKDNANEPKRPSRSVSPPSSSSSSFSYPSTPSPPVAPIRQEDEVTESGSYDNTALDLSRSATLSMVNNNGGRVTPEISTPCTGSRRLSLGTEDRQGILDTTGMYGLTPPQDKPLDLALRPIDLSMKSRVVVDKGPPSICNRGVFSLVVNGRGGLIAEALPPSGTLGRPVPFQPRNAPLNFSQAVKMVATPGLVPLNMTVPLPGVPVPREQVAPVVGKRTSATNLTVSGTIRNGVLQMKQQKQRRYRTERPFRCSHCPAGFTLRSNMERHVKQQHPEYWAVKVRGRKSYTTPSPTASLSPQTPPPPAPQPPPPASVPLPPLQPSASPVTTLAFPGSSPQTPAPQPEEPVNPPRPTTISSEVKHAISQQIKQRKALDQQQKMQQALAANVAAAETPASNPKVQRRPLEDDGLADLASVSKLLDTANDQSIQNMLRGRGGSGGGAARERDCDCTSAESGEGGTSPSQSVTSPVGSVKGNGNSSPGGSSRKSAYTSAPNRVACNFCPRKFPWSSSLRRHLLTHTGQKPFKCPECPLFFTTKSNCDRHLVRKHHNQSGSKESNSGPQMASGTASTGDSNQGAEDSEDQDSDGSPTMDDSRCDEEDEGDVDEDDDDDDEDDDSDQVAVVPAKTRRGHRHAGKYTDPDDLPLKRNSRP